MPRRGTENILDNHVNFIMRKNLQELRKKDTETGCMSTLRGETNLLRNINQALAVACFPGARVVFVALEAETFAAASARILMKLIKIFISKCPSILFFISVKAAKGVMPDR